MTKNVLPFPGQVLMAIETLADDSDDIQAVEYEERDIATIEMANVITSLVANKVGQNIHKPLLDIDLPVTVRETSPGKSHVYINKEMSWDDLCKLLDVLVDIGLMEPGYAAASRQRGFTALRLPWVKKREEAPNHLTIVRS